MKYFLPIFALLLHGCLYFNEKGVSGHLYDNCQEYYDECGIYHKECPPNLVDYSDIKKDVVQIGRDIKEYVDPSTQKAVHEPRCPPQ